VKLVVHKLVSDTFGVQTYNQWVDVFYVCADPYSMGAAVKQAGAYLKGKEVSATAISFFDSIRSVTSILQKLNLSIKLHGGILTGKYFDANPAARF